MEKSNSNMPILDFKEIQELIKLVKRSQLSEFNLKYGDFKIEMKYGNDHMGIEPSYYPPSPNPITTNPTIVPSLQSTPTPQTNADIVNTPIDNSDKLITIKAPMIGTFYRSSSPDKPPFVEVGDQISEGKILCIVEAMKLFNEIESEVSGKLVKILVEDASPVEYDQPLFLVDPS